jgi:hypothetical protein
VLYTALWTIKKALNTVLNHIPYSLHKKSFTPMKRNKTSNLKKVFLHHRVDYDNRKGYGPTVTVCVAAERTGEGAV